MTNINKFNVLKLPNQLLEQINRLTNKPIEIAFGIDSEGGIYLLATNQQSRVLAKDGCSGQNFLLTFKESCDTGVNSVTEEFSACLADEETISEFTKNKVAKPDGTGAIAYSLYETCGCAGTSRTIYYW